MATTEIRLRILREHEAARREFIKALKTDRPTLFTARSSSTVRRLVEEGLCAISLEDFWNALNVDKGEMIMNSFRRVIQLVDPNDMLDGRVLCPRSGLHEWWNRWAYHAQIKSLGGSACEFGLLWIPTTDVTASTARRIARKHAVPVTNIRKIRDAALGLLTQAFASPKRDRPTLSWLGRFSLSRKRLNSRKLQALFLRPQGISFKAFKAVLVREQARLDWKQALMEASLP